MKLAIMQPYFFPYIGYFQLINAVDKFIFFDDVNFIVRGWINRNRILTNNNSNLFSVPLEKISREKKINEIKISEEHFNKWKNKFYKTIERIYKKAPCYNDVFSLIEKVLDEDYTSIAKLAETSVKVISNYLNLETYFENSSGKYSGIKLKGSERIIEICKKEKCSEYINAIGGKKLYQKKDFEQEGIQLSFIKTNEYIYKQLDNNFIPDLSIIDVLMFNTKKETKKLLENYSLIS